EVNEIDRLMLRSRARQALTMLDFPAPDGAATMKRVPRTGASTLFNVLHLLADLVDQHLELHRDPGGAAVDRLRAQRVGLAVELLEQEVQAPPGRFVAAQHPADLGDVAVQAVE